MQLELVQERTELELKRAKQKPELERKELELFYS
jgi:hypothetical protein